VSGTTAPPTQEPVRVEIATVVRSPDGRLVQVDVLPDPDTGRDQVLLWDHVAQRPRWVDPEDLGFTPIPVVIGVPLADGAGRRVLTGDGRRIVANKPSGV
jgi:hypothetical protein